MPPTRQMYIPTEENDAKHLAAWANSDLREAEVPGLHKRYIRALNGMKQSDLLRFCAMILIRNGMSIPPFPDQE